MKLFAVNQPQAGLLFNPNDCFIKEYKPNMLNYTN